MPVIIHHHRSQGDQHMYLGANPRPRDPAEDRYRFTRIGPRGTADLTKPRLLSDHYGRDVRATILDQKQLGSCTAFAEIEVNWVLAEDITGSGVLLHPGWIYEQSRKKEGTWPQDAGAYEADAMDIVLAQGAPLMSAAPYVDQAGQAYDQLTPDPANNFLATHMPFNPSDGHLLENLWLAIDAGMPVAVAMSWLNPFFNPQGGKLPDGANTADVAGGHEIMAWGIVPGFVLLANHWSTGWSADAASFGYTMRPGDFAIPWSYWQAPADQSIIWEARAVTARTVQPDPNPPQPPPPPPPPNPPSGCRAQAQALAGPIVDAAKAAWDKHPKNFYLARTYTGAKQVLDALSGLSE